jgi:predicted dehydrogenase
MKLKMGIVGCGLIARYHYAPSFSACEYAELVGVCGVSMEESQAFADDFDTPTAYDSYEKMPEDDELDAVIVAVPNHLHYSFVCKAARAGKHVLCEKPMALTMQEAQKMVDICQKYGVVFMVAHHLRYKTANRKAKELIDSGSIGKISSARAKWSFNNPNAGSDVDWHDDPKLSGGGQMMNVNSHCLDLLVYMFGPIQEVSAFLRKQPGRKVENGSMVMIRFANDVLAMADGSHHEECPGNKLEIFGDKGNLCISNACSTDNEAEITIMPNAQVLELPSEPTPYSQEVDHFAWSIQNNAEPISSGKQVLETMRLLMAAYESAETGRHIVLERP